MASEKRGEDFDVENSPFDGGLDVACDARAMRVHGAFIRHICWICGSSLSAPLSASRTCPRACVLTGHHCGRLFSAHGFAHARAQ